MEQLDRPEPAARTEPDAAEESHMQQAYAARLKEHAAWVDAERGEQTEGR